MTRLSIRRFALLLPVMAALAACGEDKASSSNWVGKTFLLDTPALSGGHWTEPKGFGADIGAYVPQFLLGVAAASGGDMTITLATAVGGVQDPCSVTTQVPASGASYPDSQILATTFPMRIMDPQTGTAVPTNARDVTFTNVLPGRPGNKQGELGATLDVAELYSLFYKISDTPTKELVCSQFEALSSGAVVCETCAFNGEKFCLTVHAVQLGADASPTPITKISAGDIAAPCQ